MRTRQIFRSPLRNGHARRTELVPALPASPCEGLDGFPGASAPLAPRGMSEALPWPTGTPPAVEAGRERELEIRRVLESGWLDRDNRPRLAVTREREVRWTNLAARKSLRPPLAVYLQRGHLLFAAPSEERRFAAFFEALDGQPQRLPVIAGEGEGFLVMSGWSVEVRGERLATLDVSLPRPPLTVAQSGLARRFRLTRAECAVMDALVAGSTPTSIAERQGLSIHTVRTHIRHIYGKLSVRSQTQLLRVALAYCGV